MSYKRGHIPWNKGKTNIYSKATLKKISATLTGHKHTKEAKDKMKKAHKGKVPWNKGLTKETDERVVKNGLGISKILKGKYVGEKSWMYGKKHTNLNCQCASCKSKRGEIKGENSPMFGKHHSKETIKKISGKNSANWIDGRGYDKYPKEFNGELREKIRSRDNYICQNLDCNMTEEEHIIVYGRNLELHHIDYNKQNCKEDNLTTLCKQCNIRANKNRKHWEAYYKQTVKLKEIRDVAHN